MVVIGESQRQKIESTCPPVLLLFLFCSLILQNTRIPTTSAYITIAITYTIIVLYFSIYIRRIKIANKFYIPWFLLFSSLIFFRTLFNPALGDIARLLALLTFTTANLIILPQVFTFHQFCLVGGRPGGFLVVLGFLPYFGFFLILD
jgi:hypothetical protein